MRDLGMPDGHGVLITRIAVDSAAAMAGLKAVDVIQSVDGQVFDQTNQLMSYLTSRKAGAVVELKVWRGQRSIPLTATLKGTAAALAAPAPGSEIYCYATAFPQFPAIGGSVYWQSTPFALPGATRNNANEQGKIVGQQFKQYLISQGMGAKTVEAAFGICANGLANAANSLQATESARTLSAFTSTGSAGVTINWAP
ncbi:PDZ domain-containing protein [Pseudomonas sp. ABC1]|uniref:PDZ domain-containing protein n=1 Tax=Pseudomonas sp. ABC1 TaxID=2748080 RepID=UPI0015C40737|nr:PDZ domain-containing protein [Pseudomonas sp. ABC1]QLF94084.1 PDZ domain-containing protein [Pseudomonas sp. ABC1]